MVRTVSIPDVHSHRLFLGRRGGSRLLLRRCSRLVPSCGRRRRSGRSCRRGAARAGPRRGGSCRASRGGCAPAWPRRCCCGPSCGTGETAGLKASAGTRRKPAVSSSSRRTAHRRKVNRERGSPRTGTGCRSRRGNSPHRGAHRCQHPAPLVRLRPTPPAAERRPDCLCTGPACAAGARRGRRRPAYSEAGGLRERSNGEQDKNSLASRVVARAVAAAHSAAQRIVLNRRLEAQRLRSGPVEARPEH